MKVVAHVPDLMDRSKVRAAFPEAVLVNRATDLAGAALGADLVLVDLSRPGVLAAVAGLAGPVGPAGPSRRVVGFASHVDEATLADARGAGVEALARSVFFRRLPTLADPAD
jgi:hypothetical protein